MIRQQVTTWFLGATALTAMLLANPAGVAFVPAQAQVQQQLPSVADIAERLLPAVVEISVEAKAPGSDGPPVEMPDLPEDSPFKDFFDDFFKKNLGEGGPG